VDEGRKLEGATAGASGRNRDGRRRPKFIPAQQDTVGDTRGVSQAGRQHLARTRWWLAGQRFRVCVATGGIERVCSGVSLVPLPDVAGCGNRLGVTVTSDSRARRSTSETCLSPGEADW